MKNKPITHVVWVLSLVSLFTDAASEMLYPIMPFYLKSIGFSVILIGVLEGVAEAISGLSKGYFGFVSDAKGERLPFVKWGYAMSALAKPMMAIFQFPLWIFGARTIDRFGKGIRNSARDAMLSAETTPETKGAVFGFHRGMDTVGAIIGPSIALLWLFFEPEQYRPLFYIAFIPGIIAMLLLFVIKEKPIITKKPHYNFFSFIQYWQTSPKIYKQVVGLLIFTLFNSSDYFLLLKVKQTGVTDNLVIGIYILYNIVYALLSYKLGKLGDRIGLKKVLMIGLLLFAVVYVGMAFCNSFNICILLFIVYGIYAATNEGIAKAWITNMSDKEHLATAIGTFSALQSLANMLASSLAGLVWYYWGATAIFLISGLVSLIVAGYFLWIKEKTNS